MYKQLNKWIESAEYRWFHFKVNKELQFLSKYQLLQFKKFLYMNWFIVLGYSIRIYKIRTTTIHIYYKIITKFLMLTASNVFSKIIRRLSNPALHRSEDSRLLFLKSIILQIYKSNTKITTEFINVLGFKNNH